MKGCLSLIKPLELQQDYMLTLRLVFWLTQRPSASWGRRSAPQQFPYVRNVGLCNKSISRRVHFKEALFKVWCSLFLVVFLLDSLCFAKEDFELFAVIFNTGNVYTSLISSAAPSPSILYVASSTWWQMRAMCTTSISIHHNDILYRTSITDLSDIVSITSMVYGLFRLWAGHHPNRGVVVVLPLTAKHKQSEFTSSFLSSIAPRRT